MKHKKRLAAGIAVFAVLTLLSHTGMTRGLAVPIARMLPMPSSWLAMELQPTALIFAAAEVPQAKAIPRKCLL